VVLSMRRTLFSDEPHTSVLAEPELRRPRIPQHPPKIIPRTRAGVASGVEGGLASAIPTRGSRKAAPEPHPYPLARRPTLSPTPGKVLGSGRGEGEDAHTPPSFEETHRPMRVTAKVVVSSDIFLDTPWAVSLASHRYR